MSNVIEKIKQGANYVVEKAQDAIEYVQVSAVKSMVRGTFETIFKNASKELGIPLEKLKMTIEFNGSNAIYYALNGMDKFCDIIPQDGESERRIPRTLSLDDFATESGIGIDLTGGTSAIQLLIENRAQDISQSEGVPVEDLTIILKPDLANYEGKTVFKYSLPNEILKSQFPTCNGLPVCALYKRKEKLKGMEFENLEKIRIINIEEEFLQ